MRAFLRAGHLPTLVASLIHFETSFMLWTLMGALGVLIAADLGLSPSEKGLLVGVPLLGGALWRVPIGMLADQLGAKRVGVATILASLVPLMLVWRVADDLPGLLCVGLLLGIAGSSFATALPLASRTYPARYQGTAMGIAAAGNSGAVVANLVAPRIGEVVGWQSVFGLALVPAAIAALLFVALARDDSAGRALSRGRDRTAPFREPDLWWFCLLYAMTFGGYSGLSSFLAIFFHDQYGVAAVSAGGLVAGCALAGSLARPLGGALADRLGGVPVLAAVYALVPVALLVPMVGSPLPLTVAALVVGMGCLGAGNGAVFQLVPQRFGSHVGVATGVTGAAGGIGGFLLSTLLGFQKEMTGSYGPGFATFALSLAFMFLCVKALEQGWRFTWLSRPEGLQEAE